MKGLISLVFLFLCASVVLAQKLPEVGLSAYNAGISTTFYPEESFSDTVKIAEIEVFAGRSLRETGMRITRPDSLALRSGLTVDLSDLLSRYTSVYIKSYGPGAQATAHFRGTSASHSQIIWNGIRLNSPMRGYTDLSQLPLFFVDDIYLLHGGSSLFSGSGALGGTIHLDNLPDWQDHFAVKGILEQASFNTRRYMGLLKSGTSVFQSMTRGYSESSANDFPFYNTAVLPNRPDTLRNGNYSKRALLQEFYFRSGKDVTFTLKGWYQENYRNLPALMSYEGQSRSENLKEDQLRIQFGIKKYNKKFDFQFISGYNAARMHYFFQTGQEKYVIRDALSNEKSFYNLFRFDLKFPGGILSGSAETSMIRVESDDKVKKEGYRKQRIETGAFLSARWKPSDRTGLFLLTRSEYYDRKLIPLIPSAGGDWLVSERFPLLMKLNLSRNFHKPGLNDLYWNPGGNPDLVPERGTTGELFFSLPLKSGRMTFTQEISFYTSAIRNWIMWQPANNGAWYWEAVNLDRVISRGADYDFSASAKAVSWLFTLTGNYAFTRAFQAAPKQDGNDQLIYIPLHTANLHLAANRGKWNFLAGLFFTGKRYTQHVEQEGYSGNTLEPFCVTDVSVQRDFTFRKIEGGMKFNINNILNSRYQQILWRPMPLRNYSVIITIGYKK
jgi:outer membrane cobalamin receptor